MSSQHREKTTFPVPVPPKEYATVTSGIIVPFVVEPHLRLAQLWVKSMRQLRAVQQSVDQACIDHKPSPCREKDCPITSDASASPGKGMSRGFDLGKLDGDCWNLVHTQAVNDQRCANKNLHPKHRCAHLVIPRETMRIDLR